MTETGPDELSEQMAAFERASRFEMRCLLKENASERTELVSDAAGTLYVRKYLDVEEGHAHPYERLVGIDVPHMPKVVEASRIADKLVVVSEHVVGATLEQLVAEQGALSDEVARMLLSNVADALSFLHGLAGGPVIHRDVNPSNIIVNTRGAWLIDFGIARTFEQGARQDTRLWGTAGYAAPEQYGFRQTDARTDVYALGRVLAFMMTGREDAGVDDVPSAWARHVVKTATALDPRRRYRSVGLMKADCLRARQLRAEVADGTLRRRVWVAWRVAATAVVLLLALGVGISISKDPLVPHVIVNVVLYVLFCAVPWAATTNMFGVLDKVPWFGARRWAAALAIVALSFAALLVFAAFWMGAGLPWPTSAPAS